MGFLLRPGEVPKPKKDEPLVFDLVPEKPPKPKPKKQKWFVDEKANKEKPASKTNLRGVEQSTAKDEAPKDKAPDGIPNLKGKSEMLTALDQEATLGETNPKPPAPELPAPPEPMPAQPMAAAQPQPPAPAKPEPVALPKPEPGPEKETAAAPKETTTPPIKPEPEPKPNIAAASPEKKDVSVEGPRKKAAEEPTKPVEVAQLPQPTPAPPVPPKVEPASPTLPPRQMAKVKSMFPQSSAGKKGAPSFNIKVDQYAVYYKHIIERLERTWLILRRYEAGMATIGTPDRVKLIFRFKIDRSGTISDVDVVSDGGDPIMATEIERCIESTNLDPFPDFITEDELRVQPVIFYLYGY